jgi:hypothetical protein|tara:strand:+ start:8782 stop:8946 length:165 start_codon:yes stop_codon:yes gene_type:complete
MIGETKPMVTDDDFTPFLRWLVRNYNYNEEKIIDVVEKPYRYNNLYEEFSNEEI